jgi:hypothetical protein
MRARWIVAALGLLLLVPAAAVSRDGARAPLIEVVVHHKGVIDQVGEEAVVPVTVTCNAPGSVLEAFMQVTQNQGAVFGEGPIFVTCDGVKRKSFVRARPFDGPYTPGRARGSAFVLVCNESNCHQGQDVGEVLLRRVGGD